jgi:hypothetical protein
VSERPKFREGRQLSTADLNQECSARQADLDGHLELAHRAGGPSRALVGNQISTPSRGAAVTLAPTGPSAGVRVSLAADVEALSLGLPSGHRASGNVLIDGAGAQVTRALRLVSRAGPVAGPVPGTVRALDIRDDDDQVVARELRIELVSEPGSPPQQSRVAVGQVAGGAFNPVFVVDAAGGVTVMGNLEVAGSVSQGEITPDPADPRFAALLTDLVARRVVGAAVTATNPVTNPVFRLIVVPAAASTPAATVLAITITPQIRELARWGAALEIRRQGVNQFRLLRIGSEAPAAQDISISATTTWSPPLAAASNATLVAAVAAYNAHGTFAASRIETTLP